MHVSKRAEDFLFRLPTRMKRDELVLPRGISSRQNFDAILRRSMVSPSFWAELFERYEQAMKEGCK